MDHLSIKDIKKKEAYKKLPSNINKSKLNKKKLLIAIEKYKNITNSQNLSTKNVISFNNNKFIVIEIFSKLHNIYKILGDRFRSEAYIKAIKSLRHLDELPDNLKDLMKVPGIGKGIGLKIVEITSTGKLNKLLILQNDPSIQSILQLSRIAGVGPALAKKLQKMKITSIQQLRNKVKDGEFDLNNQQQLGLKYFEDLNTKIPRAEIDSFNNELQKIVTTLNTDLTVEIMGSYRRGNITSGDIDILLSHKNIMTKDQMNKDHIQDIVEKLQQRYKNVGTLAHGRFKYMGLYVLDKLVRHIDIIFIPGESLPTAISYFTGSLYYNMKMREIAKKMGYRLNEYSLKNEDGEPIKVISEKHLHEILGVEYVQPKNR